MEAGYEVTDWKNIFKEITDAFQKDGEFKAIVTEIGLNDDGKLHPALVTTFFILLYMDGQYFLSFTINKYKIEMVAYYSHILTLLLYDNLGIYPDSYVDTNDGHLYFGDLAYEKYKEKIHEKHGVVSCPVCDRLVPKEIIEEDTGFCKMCSEYAIPNMKFH